MLPSAFRMTTQLNDAALQWLQWVESWLSLSGSLSFTWNLSCFALSLRKLKPRNSYLSPDVVATRRPFRSVLNICPTRARIVNASYIMSLCGCNPYGIAVPFLQTSQITSGELLLFFVVKNLFDVPGIAKIRAPMVCFEQNDATLQKRGYFRFDSVVCYNF